MLPQPTKNKFHLQVDTKLGRLNDVLSWFEGLISPYLPQKTGWQCEVALAEAFTNAVRHAHQDLPPSTPIDLEVELFAKFLEIRVWDCGRPFDLSAELLAREHNLESLEEEGGRGLQFIKNLADELQYFNSLDPVKASSSKTNNERALNGHNHNCLVIRKKYPQLNEI